jgi:hypothetical protein
MSSSERIRSPEDAPRDPLAAEARAGLGGPGAVREPGAGQLPGGTAGSWSAVVVARPEPENGPMASRLPSYLHPVAGRPLIWHTVVRLATLERPPTSIVVLLPSDSPPELFADLSFAVRTAVADEPEQAAEGLGDVEDRIVVASASACLEGLSMSRLLRAEPGAWLGPSDAGAAAALLDRAGAAQMVPLDEPFTIANRVLAVARRLEDEGDSFLVRNRADLARVQRRIRDHLVRSLMESGTTFVLPDSVLVDVDVRIGRDTVVYPGVVLEGQTTIGDETVVGPGCRIIDSWIGSGVELKGWNYIANTSVRNRAILEPYVRRGFD